MRNELKICAPNITQGDDATFFSLQNLCCTTLMTQICRDLGLLSRLTWIVALAIFDIVVSKAGPSINIVHSQKNISYILSRCWMHKNKKELLLTNAIDSIRKITSCHLRDCMTLSSSKLSPYIRLRSISCSGKYMHDLLEAPWKPFPARMLNL